MPYTYPAPPPTVGSDLTTVEVHHLLRTPTLIRRRLTDILRNRFIADYLLAGRFRAVGGAILYETGETIYPADAPEAIAPGGEYPRTVLTSGELAAAKTVKWGQDTPVTDEAIARLLLQPVNRGLRKVANGMIRHVDGVALGVIGSKVTQTYAAAAWADAGAIIDGVLGAKAKAEEDNEDDEFDYNTVVLKPTQFAKVAGRLIKSDLVPRESQNAVLTGVIPDYLGITWTTSGRVPFTDPLLVDRDELGGMADENLGSPGYASLDGVEVKSIREEKTDEYLLRGRRVTVPVVLEPRAGIRITGTGV
ncbi:hypothetical protein [Georgenia wangjunii]|uniref:phage major capsid protein n=1 Tax=Georgenia wangjunii TaxID=3117730 RepID=UPI002F269B9A